MEPAPPEKDANDWVRYNSKEYHSDTPPKSYEALEPTRVAEFWGLDDVHRPQTRYGTTWKCLIKERHMPPQVMTTDREYAVPRHILLAGVNLAVAFASEIGLDLQPSESKEWTV